MSKPHEKIDSVQAWINTLRENLTTNPTVMVAGEAILNDVFKLISPKNVALAPELGKEDIIYRP